MSREGKADRGFHRATATGGRAQLHQEPREAQGMQPSHPRKAEGLGQLGTGPSPMDLSGSQLSSLCRLSDPGRSRREGQSRSAALVGEASDARGVWVGTGGTEIKDGSLGCELDPRNGIYVPGVRSQHRAHSRVLTRVSPVGPGGPHNRGPSGVMSPETG